MSFEDFQIALREFQSQNQVQKETKNKCSHPDSINHCEWKICVTCGLYLRRILVHEDYDGRVLFRKTDSDKTEEMKDTLCKMMTQVGVPTNHLENIFAKCEKYILPNEERCKGDGSLRIKVRIKSLCAVTLLEKMKELKIKLSMVKFCKKCGVARPMTQRIPQRGLNEKKNMSN